MEDRVRQLEAQVAQLTERLNRDNFSQVKVMKQVLVLQNRDVEPNDITITGALCVVNGELMIYDGFGWEVVGDQT